MHIKKMVLGLTAVAAVAVTLLSACSTAPTTSAAAAPVAPVVHAAAPSTSDAPPAAPAAPAPAPAPPAIQEIAAVTPGVPCTVTAKACLSISTHTAWLLDNGKVIFGPVKVMPGSPRFPTPTGTFHVLSKVAHYRSHEFHGAAMPESVFFYPGDAFHVGSLSVFSHGCVHLSWASATTFFNTLHIGDEVQIVR